jgi:hypothetical protein
MTRRGQPLVLTRCGGADRGSTTRGAAARPTARSTVLHTRTSSQVFEWCFLLQTPGGVFQARDLRMGMNTARARGSKPPGLEGGDETGARLPKHREPIEGPWVAYLPPIAGTFVLMPRPLGPSRL